MLNTSEIILRNRICCTLCTHSALFLIIYLYLYHAAKHNGDLIDFGFAFVLGAHTHQELF